MEQLQKKLWLLLLLLLDLKDQCLENQEILDRGVDLMILVLAVLVTLAQEDHLLNKMRRQEKLLRQQWLRVHRQKRLWLLLLQLPVLVLAALVILALAALVILVLAALVILQMIHLEAVHLVALLAIHLEAVHLVAPLAIHLAAVHLVVLLAIHLWEPNLPEQLHLLH